MILYHFTALEYVESILDAGLNKGDIPLARDRAINGVWFTTDPDSAGHGLSNAKVLTEADRLAYQHAFGMAPPPGARFANKRAVRITVKLSSADRDLKRWMPWARKRLAPDWLAALHKTGGGERKARSWFVCFRTIRPDEFVAVEGLDPAGGWISIAKRELV